MQDILELDRLGIPSAAVFSEEFRTAVEAWTVLYGFDAPKVYVTHPIQRLNDEEVVALADHFFEEIHETLTGSGKSS